MPFLRLFLILTALDVALTLAGQSPEYWAGDYQLANEMNAPFRWFLEQGPWFFLAGVIAVVVPGVAVILCVNLRLRSSAFFLGSLAHFVGCASWLIVGSIVEWCALIGLATFCAWHLERDWSRFRVLEARLGRPDAAGVS